ncbi:MAG: phosphatase PAP2 family protein [Planctomycetia bacterium]|nr:phosphatase PAP2 family protein [Planctomycetia bacterium]
MPESNPPKSTPVAPWWLRAALVVLGLGLWFFTQWLIQLRGPNTTGIGDRLLELTAPTHGWFVEHHEMADLLLIYSSFGIDVLAIFLLAWSVIGRSIRPFLGLLMLFALRQICQGLCALPVPPGMIWRPPYAGPWPIPSLLVTYGVANDFFFSGHTAIAVYGAVELARLGRRWLVALALGIAIFEMSTVIVLRAHWTMDVFAGAVTALLAAYLANWLAPACDRFLASLVNRK